MTTFLLLFLLVFPLLVRTQEATESVPTPSSQPHAQTKDVRSEAPKENYHSFWALVQGGKLGEILKTHLHRELQPRVLEEALSAFVVHEQLNTSLLDIASSQLSDLFSSSVSSLHSTAIALREPPPLPPFHSRLVDCSRLSSLRFDEHLSCRLNRSTACRLSSRSSPDLLPQTLQLMASVMTSSKRWQFALSPQGSHVEFPARQLTAHRAVRWASFVETAFPVEKRVVVLLDQGSLQSEAQLIRLKALGRQLLEAAGSRDKYAVLAWTPRGIRASCQGASLATMDRRRRQGLASFIDHLSLTAFNSSETEEGISHAEALKAAVAVLVAEEAEEADSIIHYVTRGVLRSLDDSSRALEALQDALRGRRTRVRINAIALADGDGQTPLFASHFLSNVVRQHRPGHPVDYSVHRGSFLVVREGEQLDLPLVASLFNRSFNGSDDTLTWSSLRTDAGCSSLSVVTVSRRVVSSQGKLLFVVGMDIPLQEVSSLLSSHELLRFAPFHTDLKLRLVHLEGSILADSSAERERETGSTLVVKDSWPKTSESLLGDFREASSGSFDVEDLFGRKLEYAWQRIPETPFVLVMSWLSGSLPQRVSLFSPTKRSPLDDLVYHRLDLQRDGSMSYCEHGSGVVSSLSRAAVFLSPSAFEFGPPLTAQTASNLWIYLHDHGDVIRYSGVRPRMRAQISALSRLVSSWKRGSSPASEYVVRRYAATRGGVLIAYPATVLDDSYEPLQQEWFVRASVRPGQIVLSGPFIDENFGELVTLSVAVSDQMVEGEKEAQALAVLAMDIPATALGRLLSTAIHNCGKSHRCVLFGESGEVFYRDTGFVSTSNKKTGESRKDMVEKFHLSHLEPLLVTQLLQQRSLLRKIECENSARAVERRFTVALERQKVHSLPCDDSRTSLWAEITRVPESNAVLVLVNASCSQGAGVGTFCPCSMAEDRRCFFCNEDPRVFDQLECECPCQCSRHENDTCGSPSPSLSELSPRRSLPLASCPSTPRPTPFVKYSAHGSQLPSCFVSHCESRSLESCQGVVGCEWCWRDVETPFCSPVNSCFQGFPGRPVKGLAWPQSTPGAAPVGPLAAGLMSAFFLFIIVVYCYRSQVSRLVESRAFGDAPLLHRHSEQNDFQFDHEGYQSAKLATVQLASFERPAMEAVPAVPRGGAPSDLGYSTMTDRNTGDESEEASVYERRLRGGDVRDDEVASSVLTTEVDVHREDAPPDGSTLVASPRALRVSLVPAEAVA